jgi:hypothetical protein
MPLPIAENVYVHFANAPPITDNRNIARQAKIASQIGRWAIICRSARIQMPLTLAEHTYIGRNPDNTSLNHRKRQAGDRQ